MQLQRIWHREGVWTNGQDHARRQLIFSVETKRVHYPQAAYSLTLAQLSVLVNPQKPLPSQLGRQGFKHSSDRQVIWGWVLFCSDRVTIESGGCLSIASLSEVAG
jgi:hypothetical protein